MLAAVLILLIGLLLTINVSAIICPNNCAGHGMCELKGVCNCFDGWTHAPDCSQKSCPFGTAWVDKPYSVDIVHQKSECSNAGICDRTTGLCKCFDGFSGNACQRSDCPNSCSGHGICSTLGEVARFSGPDYDAVLERAGDGKGIGYSNWDKDAIQICECDDGYFGFDCSQVMCPKGDDPVTINQQTRAIRMHVRTTGDSEFYSGQIGLRFQGKTVFIDLEYIYTRYYPCNDKVAFKGKFAHVSCLQATWTTQYYYFDLYFHSWPTFPKDNNLYTHFGNPNILEFFCDTSYAPAGTYCEFEDIYADNIREYSFCSNRGSCNFQTGICKCMEGYGGPSCGNATAVYAAPDSVTPGLAVNVVNYDFTSTVLQVKTAKPPGEDFNIMETIAGDQSIFYIRGDGLVGIHSIQTLTMGQTIAGGGLGIMTGGATIYDGMKIFQNGISSSVGVFSNRYYGSDNLGYGAIEIATESTYWTGHNYFTGNHLDDPAVRFRADGRTFVYGGGVHVTGGGTIYHSGLVVTEGMTIETSNVIIRRGGLMGSGGCSVNSEGIRVITGGIDAAGGMSVISAGMKIVSGMSTLSGGLGVTTGFTLYTGGLAVTGGLSVQIYGLRATGGLTVNQGRVHIVTAGLTVVSEGVYVTTGGATVKSGGVLISDSGLEIKYGGMTVSGGLVRCLEGTDVYHGITVSSSAVADFGTPVLVIRGVEVTGGITVDGGVVITHGLTVYQGQVNVADGVHLTHDIRVYGSTELENSYVVFSDRRLKTNFETIDNALDKVTALRGVYFNWAQKNESTVSDKEDDIERNEDGTETTSSLIDDIVFEKGRQIGVIAQEVQQILPEIVRPHSGESKSNKDPILTVDYAGMIPLIIESVHDLKNATESIREQCKLRAQTKADIDAQKDFEIEQEASKLREELASIKGRNGELKSTLYDLMKELTSLKARRI